MSKYGMSKDGQKISPMHATLKADANTLGWPQTAGTCQLVSVASQVPHPSLLHIRVVNAILDQNSDLKVYYNFLTKVKFHAAFTALVISTQNDALIQCYDHMCDHNLSLISIV